MEITNMGKVLLLVLCGTLSAQVAWHTDLGAARADAQRTGKMVLVAVHEAGEPLSEEMWRQLWSVPRIARHAKLDVVPLMLCFVPNGREALPRPACLPGDLSEVRRCTLQASRALFGDGARVTTPQTLLLDGTGDVLWQCLRECDVHALNRAIEAARGERRLSSAARATRVRREAERLARVASDDPQAEEKLLVLARNARPEHFGLVFDVLARNPQFASRALASSLRAQPPARSLALTSELRRRKACAGLLQEAHDGLDAAPNVVADERALEVFGPLPAVHPTQPFTGLQFTDGRALRADDLRGRPTVVMFFLADAVDLQKQLCALTPLISEMQARGVQCLALFATLKPTDDLARVRALDLPCPAATYLFAADEPLQGVRFFPATMVLDEEARVVLADDGPGDREYGAFAPLARGMSRYLEVRPTLVHGQVALASAAK